MPATSVYGLRYQAVTDAPNGATLGQNLAEDVEDELVRIDAAAGIAASNITELQKSKCVARLRRTLTATITQGTVIPWDVEDWDTLAGHSVVTNTSRYTVQVAGKYEMHGIVRHQAVAGGNAIFANVLKNGTVVAGTETTAATNSSPSAGNSVPIGPAVVQCAVNDYLEVNISNNLATAVNCDGSAVNITYVGA